MIRFLTTGANSNTFCVSDANRIAQYASLHNVHYLLSPPRDGSIGHRGFKFSTHRICLQQYADIANYILGIGMSLLHWIHRLAYLFIHCTTEGSVTLFVQGRCLVERLEEQLLEMPLVVAKPDC
jgi:hypothetical protein